MSFYHESVQECILNPAAVAVLVLRGLAGECELVLDMAATMMYTAGRELGTDCGGLRPLRSPESARRGRRIPPDWQLASHPYLLNKGSAASGAEAPAASNLE